MDRSLSAGVNYRIHARNEYVSLHVVANEKEVSYLKALFVASII